MKLQNTLISPLCGQSPAHRPGLAVAITSAGLLCLGLAGCGQEKREPEPDVRPVRTLAVSRSADSVGATYSGEIRARYESKLGFKVSGKVSARLVEVGSQVKPGQALLRLDSQDAALSAASAQAETEAARIKLEQNKIDLERGERLFGEKFISKSALDQYRLAYDTALLQLRSAQAQQNLARNQHAYTVLTADRAGVVTAIDVEAGHVVAAGQTVLTLAAEGEREVLVSVPESRVEELRTAKSMTVSTWANPQRAYAARLRELAPDTDKATRTYAARIAIGEPDAAIRLGMTASVRIPSIEAASAIRVPLTAIYNKAGESLVWVVDSTASTVATRPVRLAAVHKDSVLVAEGLQEGEVVVTAGVNMLYPGQKVKTLQPEIVVGSLQ
jgi:membrane fusion protein, multidrug efflux system